MKNNSRPWFLRNLPLRLISLFLAILMWLLVTNSNNPTIVIQVNNVAVRISNTNVLTDQGEVYTVLDNTDTIPTVYITAPRSIADAIRPENVVATADLREITDDDTVRIRLDTNIYRNQVESITGSNETLRLHVENRRSRSFTIQAFTTGEPAEGYVVGDSTLDQNQLRVSGPESVVSSIDHVAAVVDVSGWSSGITTEADIRLYNTDNEVIETTGLTMNITKVKVTVTILATKDVHVGIVGVTGLPASGYLLSGENSISPDYVTIAGRQSVLNTIQEIMLPEEAVNVQGQSSTVVRSVNLTSYLPENVRIIDDETGGIVEISIGIVPKAYQTLQLPPETVSLRNIPNGYTVKLASEYYGRAASAVTLKVSGEESDILAVTPDMVSAYADIGAAVAATEITEDVTDIQVEIVFSLPEGVEQEEKVMLPVVLEKIKAEGKE